MAGVERLFHPEMLVEMEADAILKGPNLTAFVMPYPPIIQHCVYLTGLAQFEVFIRLVIF